MWLNAKWLLRLGEVVVVVFGVVGEDGVMEVKSYHEASGVVVLALVVRHVIQCKCIN